MKMSDNILRSRLASSRSGAVSCSRVHHGDGRMIDDEKPE